MLLTWNSSYSPEVVLDLGAQILSVRIVLSSTYGNILIPGVILVLMMVSDIKPLLLSPSSISLHQRIPKVSITSMAIYFMKFIKLISKNNKELLKLFNLGTL
jgi:hypothetical protein